MGQFILSLGQFRFKLVFSFPYVNSRAGILSLGQLILSFGQFILSFGQLILAFTLQLAVVSTASVNGVYSFGPVYFIFGPVYFIFRPVNFIFGPVNFIFGPVNFIFGPVNFIFGPFNFILWPIKGLVRNFSPAVDVLKGGV